MPDNDTFRTSFCHNTHRLRDGKPVHHECFVMPTEALYAEREGDKERYKTLLAGWKNRRPHKGVKHSSR